MQPSQHLFKLWSTSSFGDAADLYTMEQVALGHHLGICRSPHGRLFALHCVAESVRGFIVSRFVTTLVIAALIIALTKLVP